MNTHRISTLYQKSYIRILNYECENQDFFDHFYHHFIHKSPEIFNKFRRTRFDHQKTMLKNSLVHLQRYYESGEANSYLMHIVKRHGPSDLNIHPDMYDHWLDAFLLTLKDCDPKWTPKVNEAWRAVLSPGIALMRSTQL